MIQVGRVRLMLQSLIVGIMLVLTIPAQANDDMGLIPPDSLVVVAVKQLMKQEKTEKLCILVGNGVEIMNISQSLYSKLKQ